jgi:hypothetical protein
MIGSWLHRALTKVLDIIYSFEVGLVKSSSDSATGAYQYLRISTEKYSINHHFTFCVDYVLADISSRDGPGILTLTWWRSGSYGFGRVLTRVCAER